MEDALPAIKHSAGGLFRVGTLSRAVSPVRPFWLRGHARRRHLAGMEGPGGEVFIRSNGGILFAPSGNSTFFHMEVGDRLGGGSLYTLPRRLLGGGAWVRLLGAVDFRVCQGREVAFHGPVRLFYRERGYGDRVGMPG